jgi:hypothetical protein
MASNTVCIRCGGTGLFAGRTSYVDQTNRPFCFGCKGTGRQTVRKPRVAKVQVVSATRKIADICGGDPTKIDESNGQYLSYLGLTAESLSMYRELWAAGVREVALSAPPAPILNRLLTVRPVVD